jgi:predicted RNA binding protein YcfA (HicA-like mRNA interferase family)
LQRDGFFIHHTSGSPFHAGDVKRGTLRSILRQANLTAEQLIDLL